MFVDDVDLPGVARAVNFCINNLDWVREDGGKEGTHEWIVLRTGSHDAFLRPYARFVDY